MIPINAVTMRGWDKLYPQSEAVRVRQMQEQDADAFVVSLEMPGGIVRYLIGADDEVKVFDTRQLCAFLRKRTNLEVFDYHVT